MFQYAVPLKEISAEQFQEFGGKAAHLGELTKAGYNVPPGFCIKCNGYDCMIESNSLNGQILDIAKCINFNDLKDIEEKTAQIRSLITNAQIPKEVEDEIIQNYKNLQVVAGEEPLVAVRSSVAVKNTSISSFPGMMDTYHYIRGIHEILYGIKKCWASLWSARGAYARYQKNIDHCQAVIAPIVEMMVYSEVAGVMFTINPVTGSKDEIMIESNWGLGETVVSGKSSNDVYVLDKASLSLKSIFIPKKTFMIVHNCESGIGYKTVPIPPEKIEHPSLTSSMLKELGTIGLHIESHYRLPQDIEWAFNSSQLYILQSRTAKVYQSLALSLKSVWTK